MSGVSGANFNYMAAMISDYRQSQSRVLLKLMQVDKEAVMTESKPLKNIGPSSTHKVDTYI